jgi:flavin-dependent thymidylate synthase
MRNKVSFEGWYGGDITHAKAAWTSTNTEMLQIKEKMMMQNVTWKDLIHERAERIPGLLKMLADNEHGTPFERSLLHFSVTCDTASHIHFLKHRMFSINGESARYREYTDDKYYLPVDWPELAEFALEDMTKVAYDNYHLAIKKLEEDGVTRKRAKESARYFLPYAIQVNLDMSCNFRTFVHFQKLRNSEHAQLEIREIAQEMLRLVQEETNGDYQYSLAAFGLGPLLSEHSESGSTAVNVP